MKLFIQFEDIKNSFGKLIRRFPLETIVIIAITSIISYSIYQEDFTDWIPTSLYSLATTFFLLLSTSLYRETRKLGEYGILLSFFPIAYGMGFFLLNPYIGQDDMKTLILFLLHLFGFAFAILFAPFLLKKRDSGEIENVRHANYFTLVSWTKIMSGIVGISVMLLGFIAIGSTIELFDLTGTFFRGKIYAYWATIALSLAAPIYALIHFPDQDNISNKAYETNRFFSFLVRFVGIPFILIYFIILYAYSLRVLLNFHNWPNGIISWLVIGFSIFGYLVYIFSEPYANEGKLLRGFRKYFPFVVIPQIFMLFYAIYLRIAQYDLTMNRYFIVVFGIWLTLISLYYTISKKKSILFLPITLAFISIAISFGPWGVFNLPLERQYNRFISNIEKVGILQNGKIIPLSKTIDTNLENEIVSEVTYICQFRSCEKLRPLFEKVLQDAENDYKSDMNKFSTKRTSLPLYRATSAIQESINIQQRYATTSVLNEKYIHIGLDYSEKNSYYPLDISGYNTLMTVVGKNISAPADRFVSIDIDNETLTIRDGANTETLSISDFVRKLRNKYGNKSNYNANEKDMQLSLVGKNHSIQILFETFYYKNPKYTESNGRDYGSYYSIKGMAIIKNMR